jgi:hypothetical protein
MPGGCHPSRAPDTTQTLMGYRQFSPRHDFPGLVGGPGDGRGGGVAVDHVPPRPPGYGHQGALTPPAASARLVVGRQLGDGQGEAFPQAGAPGPVISRMVASSACPVRVCFPGAAARLGRGVDHHNRRRRRGGSAGS